jgi:hypothetical protein
MLLDLWDDFAVDNSQFYAGEVSDVFAGIAGEKEKVGAFAGLNGPGVAIVQGGCAVAGGGDNDVERRDAGSGKEFGLAQGARALGG